MSDTRPPTPEGERAVHNAPTPPADDRGEAEIKRRRVAAQPSPRRSPRAAKQSMADLLIGMVDELSPRVASGGVLLLSGILAPQADNVIATYEARGLVHTRSETHVPESGDENDRWVLLCFEAPSK